MCVRVLGGLTQSFSYVAAAAADDGGSLLLTAASLLAVCPPFTPERYTSSETGRALISKRWLRASPMAISLTGVPAT